MGKPACVFCVTHLGEPLAAEVLEAFGRFALRYTDQVMIRAVAPQAIFLEMTRSLRLFALSQLERDWSQWGRHSGAQLRFASSRDIPRSLLKTLYPDFAQEDLASLPLRALHYWNAPWAEVVPEDPEWMVRLAQLGLHTVADFMRNPASVYGLRWGAQAVALHRAITESYPWGERMFVPPPQKQLTYEWDPTATIGPEAHSEVFWGALKSLVYPLQELFWSGERLKQLGITLKQHAEKRHWRVEFPVPQSSARNVWDTVREVVAADVRKSPLAPQSLISLTAEALKTEFVVLDTAGLWGESAAGESFEWLKERMLRRIGPARFFGATLQAGPDPQRHWLKCAVGVAPTSLDWLRGGPRPSRLLTSPRRLAYSPGDALPAVFTEGPSRWQVRFWEGPERLGGPWWEGAPWIRDYYRVATDSGQLLWVYFERSAGSPALFLQGYFD